MTPSCGLRTQKVRGRNIRAISIGTMAGRCCVKRGSIAFAKSQLTMIGLLFASGASSSSSSPSNSHGNHATKWHLVTRLLGLPLIPVSEPDAIGKTGKHTSSGNNHCADSDLGLWLAINSADQAALLSARLRVLRAEVPRFGLCVPRQN